MPFAPFTFDIQNTNTLIKEDIGNIFFLKFKYKYFHKT